MSKSNIQYTEELLIIFAYLHPYKTVSLPGVYNLPLSPLYLFTLPLFFGRYRGFPFRARVSIGSLYPRCAAGKSQCNERKQYECQQPHLMNSLFAGQYFSERFLFDCLGPLDYFRRSLRRRWRRSRATCKSGCKKSKHQPEHYFSHGQLLSIRLLPSLSGLLQSCSSGHSSPDSP